MEPQFEKVKTHGFAYIMFWCFFPLFPTDLICYTAGFMKYNFHKFLLAGMAWEAILIFLYSYVGIRAQVYMVPFSIIWLSGFIIYLIYLYYKKRKNTK
jgi:uncharacterized membrane protein YdjX (TVP38/TMEM64 family)